jgi:hypothetical protein
MATPLLTVTPGASPTYNPSMADTFSWVPVEGAGRPLFARAVYDVGAYSQLGQSGFDFIVGGQTANSGPYSTLQVVSACRIAGLTATNTAVGTLTAFELPANFAFSGPIASVRLQYGAAIVYKL